MTSTFYRHERTLSESMRRANRLADLSIAAAQHGDRDRAQTLLTRADATLAPWRSVGRKVRHDGSTRMSCVG